MKICIDLTSLADNFSGIERYAACLSVEMIKDDTVDFVLLFKNKVHHMFEDAKKKNNVKVIVIPGCKKLLFNQIRLPHVINKIKADWYLFLAFPVPIFLFKKNMVSTIHDICCWDCPETMNGMSKWYFRISHRVSLIKCKRIISISEYSKKRINSKLKYPNNKIWLIYCGVEKKFITANNEEKQANRELKEKYNLPEQYILSLSTLEPRKNLRIFIKAYRDLVLNYEFDIPLVLAGRKGWKIDTLLKDIEDKVKRRIIFTGFIDDDDLPSIYDNAYLFVFPSMYEGFGMPPLEAMGRGCIVLSSDAASMPEVLSDSAFYFENNNIKDLENKLLTLKNLDPDKRRMIREKGILQAKKFNWNSSAKKLLEYMYTTN